MSKRILGVEEYVPGIVKIKLEATKRRKIWLKVDKTNPSYACTPQNCQLYCECEMMKSPLHKFNNFEQFCNNLLLEYPELKEKLGITSVHQVVPIKRIGILY